MPSLLQTNLDAALATFARLRELERPLADASRLVADCMRAGGKLLTCGNGGSSADAAHIATEFVCRFKDDRRPYPAVCFTDSGSTLAAISNDYGFEHVFSRQVHAFGKAGDVLIALTTSGNSPNVTAALVAAREVGIRSVAFLGRTGGNCKGLADVDLIVPCDVTARIQEAHVVLYHTLCEMVELALAR